MRLLITTQAVDINDPVLGFFHGWIAEFGKHFEQVYVICLKEGEHALPENVHVYSLGKEHGENRFKYVWRFYRYAWKLRSEYDVVFSHMNPHYIVLAGLFWRCFGKRMFLWRNHAKMNLKTWIAAQFAERVFYTSPFACTRRFKHSVQMPVGIDTNLFKCDDSIARVPKSVLFLGRLSTVKRPELFMRAAALLTGYTVNVYGDIGHALKKTMEDLRRESRGLAVFYPGVKNSETPKIYSCHDIYVNLTPEGSMDKTVLEAAACGALVLVSNRSFQGLVPEECLFMGETPTDIAEAIQKFADLPEDVKREYRIRLRDMVENKHSLVLLANKLSLILNPKA